MVNKKTISDKKESATPVKKQLSRKQKGTVPASDKKGEVAAVYDSINLTGKVEK